MLFCMHFMQLNSIDFIKQHFELILFTDTTKNYAFNIIELRLTINVKELKALMIE